MAETGPLAHSPTLVASAGRGERPDDLLAAGATAGEYVVDRFLGAGAMGDVYAGHHPVIGKKVAIKVLKHAAAASPDAAERFIREARAVNQVEHPNVIDVFAFGRLPGSDGRLYLVMDLVAGRTLRTALVDGPLPIDIALHVLGEVADALDAAHARGVVHRDLKPDNVMLGDQTPPMVSVLDFGLAKLVASTDALPAGAPLTSKGTWLGTPGYMAPEQWSADGAGPASDRYALGVMAFELLSGQLPFVAGSLPQMMEQHFRTPVPALSTRGAARTLAAFDPVLERAMAKDPDARFESARAMVDALRGAAGASAKAPRRSGDRAARRHWIPVLAGAGVLGLAVAAYAVVRSPRGDTTLPAPAAHPVVAAEGIEVRSVPDQAAVWRAGRLVGSTPLRLDAPRGESFAFDVRKPGYATVHHVHRPGAPSPVIELVPIAGFEGVWALPDRELRAFQRIGDRVDVFKLDTVAGERTFYRHFDVVGAAADDDGVTFASVEDIVDARAPADPGCHVPHHVTYHYDPKTDALIVHPERVQVELRAGHCVVVSRDPDVTLALTRVDRDRTDVQTTDAPVGVPQNDLMGDLKRTKKPVRKIAAPTKANAPNSVAAPPAPSQGKALTKASLGNSLDDSFDAGQKDRSANGDSQVAPSLDAPAQAQAPVQKN